jgi:hypothetical protein
MNGAREALSIRERLKNSGDCFSEYRDMDTKVYMRCLSMYSELDLGDGLPELFALSRGDIELKLGRGARAVSTSKGTGTPRGS